MKNSHFAFWAPKSFKFDKDYKGLAHGGAAKIFCHRREKCFCCKNIFDHKNDFCDKIMNLLNFTKNFLPGSRPL